MSNVSHPAQAPRRSLKNRLWSTIPRCFRLALCYGFDYLRFHRYGSAGRRRSATADTAWLTMEYHKIEKGLSLDSPRLNFGEPVVARLSVELCDYVEKYGYDDTAVCCWCALNDYHAFHLLHQARNEVLWEQFSRLPQPPQKEAGQMHHALSHIRRVDITRAAAVDFESFAFSRHSVRNFAKERVGAEIIREAARLAQRTPSVCNRQAWRVHAYREPKKIRALLKYQNGNRGFTDSIDTLLVVTSDLGHFFSNGERNQAYIDGGLYSMSLVYALHSLGVASCCLNLAFEIPGDLLFRRSAGIPEGEVLIMAIAVGNYPQELDIASSQRKTQERVLCFHGSDT